MQQIASFADFLNTKSSVKQTVMFSSQFSVAISRSEGLFCVQRYHVTFTSLQSIDFYPTEYGSFETEPLRARRKLKEIEGPDICFDFSGRIVFDFSSSRNFVTHSSLLNMHTGWLRRPIVRCKLLQCTWHGRHEA